MCVLVAIMGLLDATTVHAGRVSAQVAVVRTAIAEVLGLRASLDWPEGADSGQLRIDIVRMAAPSLGYRRSEEHTSELQSLMRISYAVFCLKKKKNTNKNENIFTIHIKNNNKKLSTTKNQQ